VPLNKTGYKLRVAGLRGGHSGVDIHKHYASANKLIARVLFHLNKTAPLSLMSLNGGMAHNAISRTAEATFACAAGDGLALEEVVRNFERILNNEYSASESGITLTLTPVEVTRAATEADTAKMLGLLMALPHGVAEMSASVAGFVETSNNLAHLEIDEDALKIAINHLTQTLPNIAFSDTPLHSLRLHTTASLNYLTYTLLSQHDHFMAHATSIATSTPPHTTPPDPPHTLNTITQHFTSRLLTGLHTLLHTSVNAIYPSDARRAKARTGKHKASTRGACCNGHCQARLPYNAPICTQSGQPMHAYCAQPGVSPLICTQCYAIPLDLTDI
jgi:hypothetical protein